MKIVVNLFGPFRELGQQLEFTVETPIHLNELKALFLDKVMKLSPGFSDKDLISNARFATTTELLSPNFLIDDSIVISIIPPVSGG